MQIFPLIEPAMAQRHRAPCNDGHGGGTDARGGSGCDGSGHCAAGDSRLFAAMGKAYRASGGLVRGDDLVHVMAARRYGDYLSLARQIVAREVLSFDWNDSFWLPMFQFDPRDLSLRPELRELIKRLHTDMDGWNLSVWFAQPNARLRQFAPVDRLSTDLQGVLAAAHADHIGLAA
jgi:hypothetical protein